MWHDAAYFDARTGKDVELHQADSEFIDCAWKHGLVGKLMAAAVGASRGLQMGLSSPADDSIMKKNLRVVKATRAAKTPQREQMVGAVQLSAPAAISTVFTSTPTRTKNTKNGISVVGKEYIGTVEGNGVNSFGIGKVALLSPAYFYGGVLGQLARSYTKYKFTKLVVHYIPKVATNLAGQVVLCSQENITMPALRPESATFLQRALVSGNGVMCPVWTPCKMNIKTDNRRRYIDAFTNSDINENIYCDVQCYTQVGVSGEVGNLWLEYECELTENRLEPHANTVPIQEGPGDRVVIQDSAAATTAGEPATFTDLSGLATGNSNGAVIRFVMDIQGSTAATGTTLSNAWKVATTARTTGGGNVNSFTVDTIVGGMTIYFAVMGANLYAYVSLEAAIAGNGSGQIFYNTSGSTKATWVGDATLVRHGNEIMDNVQ